MIEIWDYFMRRKKLLLLVLAIFAGSSFISFRLLNRQIRKPESTYISISDWGEDAVNLPKTGSSDNSKLPVLSPAEVAGLALPPISDSASDEKPANNPYTIVPQPENIVSDSSRSVQPTDRKENSPLYNIFLTISGLVVLTLGSYLTYWHFMR